MDAGSRGRNPRALAPSRCADGRKIQGRTCRNCDNGQRDCEPDDAKSDRFRLTRYAVSVQRPGDDQTRAQKVHQQGRGALQFGERDEAERKRNVGPEVGVGTDEAAQANVLLIEVGVAPPARDADAGSWVAGSKARP